MKISIYSLILIESITLLTSKHFYNQSKCLFFKFSFSDSNSVRDITKLRGYPRSNVKTGLEQSNLFLASGRFPLQNAIYDNKLPFSWM